MAGGAAAHLAAHPEPAGAGLRGHRDRYRWSRRAVSDYYLSWHLLLRGVQLDHIRGARGLHEALAVRADRMPPGGVFHLGTATAIAYADIAHTLLERVC